MAKVIFQNVDSERIRKAFLKAYNQYTQLKDRRVKLQQLQLSKTTMQAQPIINPHSFITGKLDYQVKLAKMVRDSQSISVDSLPDEVLEGWFAHELGHIQDYIAYGPTGMIWYGIKYYLSAKFRKHVEHEADRIAIQNGFAKEILAVKRFVFNHDLIGDRYKNQMKKFYMSVEEVETCIQVPASFAPSTSEM